MTKYTGTLAAILLLTPCLLAQDVSITQRQSTAATRDSQKTTRPKLTPEQRERAMQLLDGAAAGARALDPASRAFALIQVARAYQPVDKKKTIEMLEEAITASKSIEQDDSRSKRIAARLQEQAARALVPLAPEKVDELLLQLQPGSREQAFNALLDYYDQHKKLDRAIDVLYQLGQDSELPYGSASRIMEKLGPEQQAEKQQIFTVALASFQNHEPQGARFGAGDFPNMILEFANDLPPSLVHQAVDVALDKAKKQDKDEAATDGPSAISIASDKGAVQFNSIYSYRLFQLMPVLQKIDPEEAERLLKEQNDLQTLFAKYPQGMNSISGSPKAGGVNNTSFSVNSGGPRGGSGGPSAADLLERQREAQIQRQAEDHPQDALANAATLQTPYIRAGAYTGIARATWKKNTSIARQALQKSTEAIEKMDPTPAAMATTEVARIYLRMEDTDSAKKVIEKGVAAIDKLYRSDINADDPNKAPKAYWPSTAAWSSMLSLASEISPLWAGTLLKEIPDDDIKTLVQLGIAVSLLNAKLPLMEVMTFNKEGGTMMIMSSDDNVRPR